ncbi:DUF4401 domain-containing protein [Maritalea porphyrae]|uniref:DUF4401 domain-containing protein n=1 Tax=Maritalea porphyrae TaxID=880732 RepID=A0ABQ5UMZ8_9HYPH|nr:DUF4401 domain-containing protein [Maritalea porphyrae]GLQ16668.1 hypothetical protein GCM10007879_09170 [Maritalea porphyrae]
MLSREQAITRLGKYGVPFSEEVWQSPSKRKDGEFGIFAIIIRVIAGLFILGMVIVSIAGFIAILGLSDNWEHVVGTIGVLATAFSAWKFRYGYKALEKQYSFRGLLYLSLLLVGKACLLLALFGWFETWPFDRADAWIVAIIFSGITIVSCVYYRMYLEAFLAVLVSLFLVDAAFGIQMMKFLMPEGSSWPAYNASDAFRLEFWRASELVVTMAVATLIVIAAILVLWQRRRYLSSVYLYAVVLFLAYKLLPADNQIFRFFIPKKEVDLPFNWGLALILFAASLAIYAFLIGGWQKLKSLEHVIVICCIVILAVLGMHGVLFAIALMALGHMRHDKVLWVVGLIYLPVYLFLFYFSLDVILLTKSYMLLGSGIFILAARFVLTRFFNPSLEVENA